MKKIALITIMLIGVLITISAQSFEGTWEGNISGLPFELKIWQNSTEIWNCSMTIQGGNENLTFLGSKNYNQILYFFRNTDKAAISLFFDNNILFFSYFEMYSVRKVTLSRK